MLTRATQLILLCLFAAAFSLPARADFQVNVREDKVVLEDGTEIECIVVMVSERGVLIVEVDPDDEEKTRQRLIPKAEVSEIVHGTPNGDVTGFQTEPELAHKVVQGVGFRKQESKKKAAEEKDKKAGPSGPIQALNAGKTVKLGGDALSASNSKLSAKDLADAYLSRFPALKDAAQGLIGVDRVPNVLDQAQKGDPQARRQVESFLRLFLSAEGGSLAEKPGQGASPKTPKPAKPVKKAPAEPK